MVRATGLEPEYGGDEFGGGTGSLYFRAISADELWQQIVDAFPNDSFLDGCVVERMSKGGSQTKLRK
jgi:hypothetical protein